MTIELDGYNVKVGGDTGKYVTTDVVYVSCKDCGEDMLAIIEQLKKFGIYKSGKEIYFPSYVEGRLELRQGSPRGPLADANIIIDRRTAHYTFFNASPSQERVGDFMAIDERKYGADKDLNKFKILNNILGGALEYMITEYPTMDTKKALKMGTRLALHNTAAVELGKVGNDKYGVLYIKNVINGADDYTDEMKAILAELDVDIDTAIVDGQGWILASMVGDYFRAGGVEVKDETLKGCGLQMRTEGINDKTFELIIDNEERDVLVENLIAANQFKLDKDGNPTDEAGYVIVGNPDNIAYIIDANGAKLPNMWRFDEATALAHGVEYGNFTMNILAVADASDANTSIQAIGKVVNEEVMEAITDNQYNMLVDSIDRITSGQISMDTKAARAQKLFAANPSRAMRSHEAHKMLLAEVSDQALAAIRKVKIPVDGLNLRAFFDNTFLYTGNEQSIFKVLDGGVVEAYSASVNKKFRKELKQIQAEYLKSIKVIDAKLEAQEIDAVIAVAQKQIALATRTNKVDEVLNAYTVKYPCPTNIEFAKFRYLADFEVVERVEALEASADIKRIIRNMFLGLKDGIVMIAPLNTLKHKLAGMDTDFDGITTFFEKSVVKSAFSKDINKVVYIDKKGEKSPFNPNVKEQDTVVEETKEEEVMF